MREEFPVNLAILWLVALVLSGAVVGTALRARRRRRSSTAPLPTPQPAATDNADTADLDPYQVAYLVRGPRRVLDTVLSAMLDAGTIRMPQPGRLCRATEALAPAHPLEQAVLAALPGNRSRPVHKVRDRVATCAAMRELRRHLVQRDLYEPAARVKPPWWVVLTAAISAPAFLVAIAVLLPPPGVGVDQVASAFGLTVVAGFLGVGLHPRSRRHPAGPTRAGNDLLAAVRASRTGLSPAQKAAAAPVGVALYGLSALPDPALAAALGPPASYAIRPTTDRRDGGYAAGGYGYRDYVGGGWDASDGGGGCGGDGGGGGGGGI